MADYNYSGCITGFSASGNIQLIAPTKALHPVVLAANAYTERLIGMGLLLDDESFGGGNDFNWSSLSLNDIVVLDGHSDGLTNFEAEINGKIYNKDGASFDLSNALYDLNIMKISGGYYEGQGTILEAYNVSDEILNVKLTALPDQMNTTTKFIDGTGVVLDGNVFLFRLAVNPR